MTINKFEDFDTYQNWTEETAIYTSHVYPHLALAEEVGELLGKLAKFERDVMHHPMPIEEYQEQHEKLITDVKKEGGDVLWQLARVLKDLGISMSDCARGNVEKLTSRRERNVISGSGDDR